MCQVRKGVFIQVLKEKITGYNPTLRRTMPTTGPQAKPLSI